MEQKKKKNDSSEHSSTFSVRAKLKLPKSAKSPEAMSSSPPQRPQQTQPQPQQRPRPLPKAPQSPQSPQSPTPQPTIPSSQLEAYKTAGFRLASSKTVTAKILQASYDYDTDTVLWDTLLPDGSPFQFSWPLDKYGHAIEVAAEGVRIPDKLLFEHLDSLTKQQKEFTWLINTLELTDDDYKKIDIAMQNAMDVKP